MPAAISNDNLVGRRFGMIMVKERLSKASYMCRCACGNEIEAWASELLRGRVRSCGCGRWKTKSDDIAGMRSGRLVAIEQTSVKRNTTYLWRCRCDCGNETLVEAYRIKRKIVQSCGCVRRERNLKDLTGQRFGRLTAIRRMDEKAGNCYKWLCRCDCGRETEVSTTALLHGGCRSCGCLVTKHAYNNIENGRGIKENSHLIDGTCVEKLQNKDKLSANNTSGCTGVCAKKGKWIARITFKGKVYNLGTYVDINDAIAARKKAEQRLFGEFLEWYYETYVKDNHEYSAES